MRHHHIASAPKLWLTCALTALAACGSPRPANPAAAVAPGTTVARSGFFTTSDDVRLHYLDRGSGPALVFVPGWTMAAHVFEPQLADLGRDHRVIAFDPRSHGRSDKPADGHYPERRAADIDDLLRHLDLRDVTLAGWSLGVNEVLTFLEHHGAERIRALILIDGIVGFDPKPGTTNPLNVSDEEAAAMLLALQHDRRALMSDLIRGGVRKPHSDADLERLIDLTMAVPTTTAFTVMANYLLKPPDGRPTLRNVERPVLYVIADHLAWQAAIVKAVKPDVRVEVFRDAGHLFLVDEPERFNALVRNFVASLR